MAPSALATEGMAAMAAPAAAIWPKAARRSISMLMAVLERCEISSINQRRAKETYEMTAFYGLNCFPDNPCKSAIAKSSICLHLVMSPISLQSRPHVDTGKEGPTHQHSSRVHHRSFNHTNTALEVPEKKRTPVWAGAKAAAEPAKRAKRASFILTVF